MQIIIIIISMTTTTNDDASSTLRQVNKIGSCPINQSLKTTTNDRPTLYSCGRDSSDGGGQWQWNAPRRCMCLVDRLFLVGRWRIMVRRSFCSAVLRALPKTATTKITGKLPNNRLTLAFRFSWYRSIDRSTIAGSNDRSFPS